jgi:hypothetical protein
LHEDRQEFSALTAPQGVISPTMERRPGILRRYGLALLLVGVMGYMLVTTTLPAAAERDRMRELRAAQERTHQDRQREVAERQAWLHGMQHDPLLQRRMEEQQRLSPDVEGPVLVPPGELLLKPQAEPRAETPLPPSLKTARPSNGR